MKIEKMFVAFTLLLSVFFLSSCSDDDSYEPITLQSPDSTFMFEEGWSTLDMTPFRDDLSLYIQGGDGKYVIENTDNDVVAVNYDGKTLVVKPIAVGHSSIHIRDHSNNSLTIYVNVDYLRIHYTVTQLIPYVVGDDLTIKEKKQLEEEIVANMPVAVGGRYEFIYNSPEGAKGEVIIYPDRNSKSLKGTFVAEDKETEERYRYT